MNQEFKTYLFVGCGGMVGATLRYSLSLILIHESSFPYATLSANLIGCFLLGYLLSSNFFKKLPAHFFLGLTTGLVASFTTMSTFSLETVRLWENDQALAFIYIILSIVVGIFLCLLGYKLNWRKKVIK